MATIPTALYAIRGGPKAGVYEKWIDAQNAGFMRKQGFGNAGPLVPLVPFFQTISDSCYTRDTLKKGDQRDQGTSPRHFGDSFIRWQRRAHPRVIMPV